MMRRTGRTRRTVAGAILAALALAWSPRPAAAHPSHECPPPAPGVAAVAPAPDHCHDAQSGPCDDMLGCLASPPGILTPPATATSLATHDADSVARHRPLHGRLALGPPPPPPNR